MFMIMKRKTVIIAGIALIAVISAVSLSYSSQSVSVADADDSTDDEQILGRAEMVSAQVSDNDFFVTTREKRSKDRDATLAMLNDVVNNTAASSQSRADASDKINTIADYTIKESASEELIIAKGYKDAVVYISDSQVDVVVRAKELTDDDISKIYDVIIAQTGNNNIKIVAVE